MSASRPEFAFALIAALESADFSPATNRGQPTGALLTLEQTFKLRGFEGVPTEADLSMASREREKPETIVALKTLDTPLTPLTKATPPFPYAAASRKIEKGDAVIEFIIDEDGIVRIPRIVQASDPSFGYAAVQAAAAWRFQPPRVLGKPVATRARLPFTFIQTP